MELETSLLNDVVTYLQDDFEEGQQDVLLILIKNSIREVCNRRYPFGYTEKQKADAVSKYYNVIFDVAVYLYAKQGAEGQTSHNENSISRGYESAGIPESYLSSITPVIKAF